MRLQRVRCIPTILAASLAGRACAVGTVSVSGPKARMFKNGGHPLVFEGAIKRTENVQVGEAVDVLDGAGELIGWGVWNPHSLYRVRMLVPAIERDQLEHRSISEIVRRRLQAAASRRAACCLPSESTTAYRLVNSEGDRLSGLTVDVFGSTAVAISSALWLELRREAVEVALLELAGIETVVWRRSDGRLRTDGWNPPEASGTAEGEADGVGGGGGGEGGGGGGGACGPQAERPAPAPPVTVLENGLKYLVAPVLGQKSGFYCDQRDNRAMLAELCAGRRLLDLYCYSGGFSLAAAAAGATSTHGVDSSAAAIGLAQSNAALNGFGSVCEFSQSDVPAFLKREGVAESFDVVVCDPPKLAPSVKDLRRAGRKYRQINSLAMSAVRPGGLLLSCTCSAAMTQSGGFLPMLHEAATAAGRSLTVLRTSGPACDHTLHPCCPESNYLTAVLVQVS